MKPGTPIIPAWIATLPLVWTCVLLAAGCTGRANPDRWMRHALETSRMADRALADEDRATAVGLLKDLARTRAPDAVPPGDGRMLRQDACFRLALLRLEQNRPERALRWTDYGLELGRVHDLFTANLLVARGHANQALGHEKSAARDYHQALRINEQLMDQALGRPE